MRIKVYLDEDVAFSFAQALKNRGIDVVTTQEEGNKGLSDSEQLQYAIEAKRVLFTHNKKDFAIIHKSIINQDKKHYGIIISDQLPIGDLLKRFMKLWFKLSTEEMLNRLEFLNNWK